MVIATARRYSLEDYRSREAAAEERHEYRDGEIIEMPGGSANHSRIAGCLYVLLDGLLAASGCEVFNSDLRLWIPEVQRGTYPDVMVTDGAPIFNGDRDDEILNPALIVEVLSPSTEAYDRGDKFHAYQTIPSLRDYLLVSQDRPRVEHYEKIDRDRWNLTNYTDLDSAIAIQQPAIAIPLKELYRRVSVEERSETQR